MVVVRGLLCSPPSSSFGRHQWTTVLNVLSFVRTWGGDFLDNSKPRAAHVLTYDYMYNTHVGIIIEYNINILNGITYAQCLM